MTNSSKFSPCPLCGAEVNAVETVEAFQHAGSTYWRTTVLTLCFQTCWQGEPWKFGDYGTAANTEEGARQIWNNTKGAEVRREKHASRALALALAKAHATGWKGHAEHVGEPPGMNAERWAECNWQCFAEEAAEVLDTASAELSDGEKKL